MSERVAKLSAVDGVFFDECSEVKAEGHNTFTFAINQNWRPTSITLHSKNGCEIDCVLVGNMQQDAWEKEIFDVCYGGLSVSVQVKNPTKSMLRARVVVKGRLLKKEDTK
ncbi:MAG TPA: hypothetical protein VFI56_23200 [Vicinamibacterales bacterium]|nr:hypothetical protein [Vicinamibacterales bacterium]